MREALAHDALHGFLEFDSIRIPVGVRCVAFLCCLLLLIVLTPVIVIYFYWRES